MKISFFTNIFVTPLFFAPSLLGPLVQKVSIICSAVYIQRTDFRVGTYGSKAVPPLSLFKYSSNVQTEGEKSFVLRP